MAGYGDDSGLTAYLAGRGLTLPAGAPAAAVLRQRGSDYLDATYGPRLHCSAPAVVDQERAWPRIGAAAYGEDLEDDAIPAAWVRASYRAAWLAANAPGALDNTVTPNARVKMQKAGEVAREVFEGGSARIGSETLATIDAEIEGLVRPYLCDVSGQPGWAWA
jgi:hypothetical protein